MNGTLRIDLREQEHFIEALRAAAPTIELEAEAVLLDIGDYAVGDVLGIEHKSPNDFVGSIGDRLFNQAHELAGAYQRAIILVDGNFDDILGMARAPEEAQLRGFIASLELRERCSVLFCGNTDPLNVPNTGLVPMVLKLAQKATTTTSRVYNPLRRGGTKEEHGAAVIAALPGIGLTRAQRILTHYKSPMLALMAVDTWHEHVDGIGKKTAQKARDVVYASQDSADAPAAFE